ncbi:hypothetical protein [Helcococcus ovis]|uniref:hypothetical protein n=1 Tax=Helcococcus ovis TaxID=72026 RepID=UPI0038BB8490
MKKYSILIRTILVFLVVFILNFYLFDMYKFSYIIKSIITFTSIFIVLYFTKEDNKK